MIISSALRTEPRAEVTWSPLDDRWYRSDLGLSTDGGGYFGPETMFRCSTVLAAVRFLATSVALCRPQIIRQVGDERRPEPRHYAQQALRRPHPRFTDFEWMELNVTWQVVYGNSYNRILPSQDSPIGTLTPLEPWRTRVVDQANDGGLIYSYTPARGKPVTLTEDQLLRFPGLSIDGIEGARMYQLMQNVVTIALLAERHTSQFLAKGARIGGMLVPKNPLEEEQRDELVTSFNQAVGGTNKTGTIALLPYGVDFQGFTQNNKDSQLIELSDSVVGQLLRFIGVPGVVVGFADKTATYASADAFFEKGGIKHSVMPVTTRFERRVDHSLIYEPDVVCKCNLDALLRANTTDRYAALFRATGRPWMTGNEARAIEDMNRIEDPGMDEVAMPTNLTTQDLNADSTGSTKAPRQASAFSSAPDSEVEALRVQAERGRQMAILAAARVVRRELATLRDRVTLAARDPKAWGVWVTDFYRRQTDAVAREMDIADDVARLYTTSQRDALLSSGMAITETWEETAIAKLARLAFGEES